MMSWCDSAATSKQYGSVKPENNEVIRTKVPRYHILATSHRQVQQEGEDMPSRLRYAVRWSPEKEKKKKKKKEKTTAFQSAFTFTHQKKESTFSNPSYG